MPTREERLNKLRNADDKIKELYDSPVANALNAEMREKYEIPEDKTAAYLHATGDVILGFYTTAELPRLLQTEVGLSKEAALNLIKDITEFLGPVFEREAAAAAAKKDELTGLAEKIAAIKPLEPAALTAPATPASNAATNPQLSQPVEPAPQITPATPIRTMATDAARAHGYGAAVSKPATAQPATTDVAEPIHTATPQDQLRPLSQ